MFEKVRGRFPLTAQINYRLRSAAIDEKPHAQSKSKTFAQNVTTVLPCISSQAGKEGAPWLLQVSERAG